MGSQCSCAGGAAAVVAYRVGTEAVAQHPTASEDEARDEEELVVDSRVAATEAPAAHAPAAGDEELVQDQATPPKPRRTSSPAGSRRSRRPTWCAPEAVIGEWRTHAGSYEISWNERLGLNFQEKHLSGVLRLEGEWYAAEIRDGSAAEDKVFGYLRLQRQGEVIRSQFKPGAADSWEGSKTREARRLPYLRIGAAAAAKAAAEGVTRRWEQSTCCICFEALEDGEDFAELECHHMFHKSCIRNWFQRNGNCPMRCGGAEQRS